MQPLHPPFSCNKRLNLFKDTQPVQQKKKIPFEQEVSSNPEVRGKRKKRSFTWITLNSNLRWGHIIKVNISPTECVLWWFPQHLFFWLFFFFLSPKRTSLIHSPEFQFLNVLEFTQEVMLMIDTPFMTSAGSITGCLLLDAVTFGFIYIYIPIYINGVGWYGCQVYCNIFVGGCHSWHSYILTLFFFFFFKSTNCLSCHLKSLLRGWSTAPGGRPWATRSLT